MRFLNFSSFYTNFVSYSFHFIQSWFLNFSMIFYCCFLFIPIKAWYVYQCLITVLWISLICSQSFVYLWIGEEIPIELILENSERSEIDRKFWILAYTDDFRNALSVSVILTDYSALANSRYCSIGQSLL